MACKGISMADLAEKPEVVEVCKDLRNEVGCDFVALAIQNKIGHDVKWHFATGNRNDKYKRITVRYGKGISGKVISTGRPLMIADFPNDISGKVLEYPIMLAELLISAYAVPVFLNGVPKGVLLIGKRNSHLYTEKEQEAVKQKAKRLEEIVHDNITL